MAATGAFESAFPPELVERYEFERPLGEGGMGAVYLARDRDVQAHVAIKLVNDPGQEDLVRRFLRECEILADMDHPCVVHVYEYGLTSKGPYLVMRYIPGQSLDKVDDLADPERLLFQLADAIQAIHEKNIVHRDIKPANVMVNQDDEPVLIDFGVVFAAELSRLTQTGGVAGTMAFLSPELLRGHKATAASDWYAWGITAYMTVEGVPPYTPSDLFSAAADGALPPPPLHRLRKYPGLATAILACLSYHIEGRPADLAALMAIAEGVTADDLPSAGDSFHRITAATSSASEDPVARRFYEDGLDKARRGDLAGARSDLQRALAYDEGDPAIWREMGIILALDGRWDGALEAADRAVAASSDAGRDDAELLRLRAYAQERCGQEAAAAASFKRFLEICPEDSFVTAREVAEQKLVACQADAEVVANTFVPIALESSGPGGYSQPPSERAEEPSTGSQAAPPSTGSKSGAWDHLPFEVPRCDPPRPPRGGGGEADAIYTQALEAWARDDFLDAENLLRKLALYHSDYALGTRELGLFLVDRGEYQQALLPLRDRLTRKPDDYEVIRFQAMALQHLDRPDEAAAGYRRFLELAPKGATRPRVHAERQLQNLESLVAPSPASHTGRGMQVVPGSQPAKPRGGSPLPVLVGLAALGLIGWTAFAPATSPVVEQEVGADQWVGQGKQYRVPIRFLGHMSNLLRRLGGHEDLATRMGQQAKDASADGAFDVVVPEGDLLAAIRPLVEMESAKALGPLWELVDYADEETREFGRSILTRCETEVCARGLKSWAMRTHDLPDSKDFEVALRNLLDHPHPEARRQSVLLMVRLFQIAKRSGSDTANESFDRVVQELRNQDPEALIPAIEHGLKRFAGDAAVVLELEALRNVLTG